MAHNKRSEMYIVSKSCWCVRNTVVIIYYYGAWIQRTREFERAGVRTCRHGYVWNVQRAAGNVSPRNGKKRLPGYCWGGRGRRARRRRCDAADGQLLPARPTRRAPFKTFKFDYRQVLCFARDAGRPAAAVDSPSPRPRPKTT